MFSVRQIQYFVITVSEGSISGAAKTLDVSPQAVSKAVNDMEQSLGRPLFTRKSTGLKPTPYGKSLYKKARRTLREIHDFEDYARGYPELHRRNISIMLCTPKFANFQSIAEMIQSFIQNNTDMPTNVMRGPLESCIENLAIGAIDAFVTIGHTDLPNFDVNVIDALNVGALMTDRNPLASERTLHLEDFKDIPLYMTPAFSFFHESVVEALMRSKNVGALKLATLDMTLHGVFRALVYESGAILMPSIKGLDNWLPETVVLPFATSDMPRVPLCLVTDRDNKSESALTLKSLLLASASAGMVFTKP